MLSADVHRAKLKPILEEAAASLLAEDSRVTWHIEDIPSIHYAIILLLVFVDSRVPDQDLVVVDVSMSNEPQPSWSIDAIRRDATLIAEDRISSTDAAEMTASADVAAARLSRFLGDAQEHLADALSTRTG